ncbi:MAG: glucosamine-6-phosphate deaminase [Clostridia bacterium]|nr:glucosamine-6-phosphate deaminase [Clostridia bacterium]MBQ9847685.1 glucosamine-6-phosphate deaminase [Clostridia bacterium]
MKSITKDKLNIEIYDTRAEMGNAAGNRAAELIKNALNEKSEVNVIFAAAPSQNETLAKLISCEGIDWERVNAFHMDEYIGLEKDAPQGFGNFLKDKIFGKLPFKSVNYINGQAEDMQKECERYSALLKKNPVDIVLLGIGENGHIAFNDPHVADFNDKALVKAVKLDDVCRQQQVNDGCFSAIDKVPQFALTLTIPTLVSAKHLVCTVPAATKAWAVERTVNGEISEQCPATIMRLHDDATMYCDSDSGKDLL